MIKILNKLLDVIFNINVKIVLFYFNLFKNKRKNKFSEGSGVMALPYYSENYAGGHTRIADWKNYFDKSQIRFDVYWASESDFFIDSFYSKNPLKRYHFFFHVFRRRIQMIKKLHEYEVIWIQRAFIPFYPFKEDKFEKLVMSINPNVIIDFYDADYESNYSLTINAAKSAAKVTVASNYLYDYFKKINSETYYLPFAINHEDYITKNYISKKEIIIGWMGSPTNFKNIINIESALEEVERLNPNVSFVFICRDSFKMKLKRVKFMSWGDEGFDYHETISSFDIGLAPMMDPSERNRAKTAFKSLEYMSSGLAFVSSPWGIPNHLVHNENVLFAKDLTDWTKQLSLLIKDKQLRKKIGNNGYDVIVKHFSYSNVFINLKKILINK